MVKSTVMTASGVVESTGVNLHSINVTQAGTTSVVTVYDNTTNSGRIVFQCDGDTIQSYPLGDYAGSGVYCNTGVYVEISGTAGTVVVNYV